MKSLITILVLGVISAGTVVSQNATFEDFPYQASIQRPGIFGRFHACSGAILTQNVAISAAQCIANFIDPRAFMVYVGGSQFHSVIEFTIHPLYLEGLYDTYDVALFKVETNFEFSSTVATIPLHNFDSIETGAEGVLSAWNRMYEGSTLIQELQGIPMKTSDPIECQSFWGGTNITENMLCVIPTGILPDGMESGEAGSPFVLNKALVGVASFGVDANMDTRPGVLTLFTPDIRRWIYETLAEYNLNVL